MERKTVFLTGATGVMGWAGLQELLSRSDRFDIVILARRSRKNIRKLKPLRNRIKIVWGDLTCYSDVLAGVTGADYVLHVGGMVSPAADYHPKATMHVNVTSAQNVVRAILAQPNADKIKAVYIGSVAETSDRGEPVHWGRTGDPVYAGIYDFYGLSKIRAERIFAESGLKYWVCLRQSGILHPGIFNKYDPLMFHVPIRGMLEWSTVEDSGRLLANVCEPSVPDEFWNRFYNISSGAAYRLGNYEFECRLLTAISCPRPEKIFDTRWFVLRNFHGQFYLDADVLENYLHFRANVPVDSYFRQLGKQVPWFYHIVKIVPNFIVKCAMRRIACRKEWGTQWWIRHHDIDKIKAYYGSWEACQSIPDWGHFDLSAPAGPEKAVHVDHGYDEGKPMEQLTLDDLQRAAEFRGGSLLAVEYDGNPEKQLEWVCHEKHHFQASPKLILEGGHWCPECEPPPWKYDEWARHNPFFAQIWYPHRAH